MINFGPVPIGAVLPVLFSTYNVTTGASVTLTGLAVTDIEIYKGISATQRASDNGYTLMDTDGIDVDSIVGVHGFSIDTGDNSDAGFFAAGSFYTVVVSSVTVDAQTVNVIAATFRCVTAEGVAGQPKVDVAANAGTAITASAGIQEVKVASLAANSITATAIASDAITDAKVAADVTIASVTGAVGSVTAAGTLTSGERNSIADALLNRDMSTGADSGSTTVRTVRQALRFLRNKWSLSGSTLTVTKEDDSTTSFTATIATTSGANPITSVDPAGP